MGTTITPRHRAETPWTVAWGDLRRNVAQLLAGRDLYADDEQLRASTVPDSRDAAIWTAVQPSQRLARRTT